MSEYAFTLKPSFTQGLLLGQLSILILLALVLKYLFLDSNAVPLYEPSYGPLGLEKEATSHRHRKKDEIQESDLETSAEELESAEWFNLVVKEVRLLNIYIQHRVHIRLTISRL